MHSASSSHIIARTSKQEVFSLNTQVIFTAVLVLVLTYSFLNGMNDSGGLVAAAISSRSMSPRFAHYVAACAEFTGPFLFGTAVAATIGKDLVEPGAISLPVLFIAVLSAIAWNVTAWYTGLPSSSTHALLGGLIGAVSVGYGFQGLRIAGFAKVLLSLFAAPFAGSLAGYAFMRVTQWLTQNATPHVNLFFKYAQPFNVIALALSHGANDGQKAMGLVAMALVAAAYENTFVVPIWATLLVALALMSGVGIGSSRILRTVGNRIYKLRPVHAFAAQTASATVVLGAALLGGPVSSTQVVSTAIMGVGSAERVNAVRWHIATQIMTAWLVTIPASAILAAILGLIWTRWSGF